MQLLIASINTVNALYVNEFASGRFMRDLNSAIDTWQELADRNQREFSEIWANAQPHVITTIRFIARMSARLMHWYECDRPVQLQSFLTWLAATYAWFVEQIPTVEEIYTEIDEMSCDLWDLVDVQPMPVVQSVQWGAIAAIPLLPPAKIEPAIVAPVIQKRRGKRRK